MSANVPTRIWWLHITSFRGISVGATHFYAELRTPTGTARLTHPLSAAEAAALTARDNFDWEPGWPTERFDTREDVTAAALAVFTALAEPGCVLLAGNAASAQPQPVLAGPPELVPVLRGLHDTVAELEAASPDQEVWIHFPQQMGAVVRAWYVTLAPLRGYDERSYDRADDVLVHRAADGTWTFITPPAAASTDS